MASPANPFAALHQAQVDGAAGSTGRGRGNPFRGGTAFQPRGAASSQPRGGSTNAPFRGRGRGRGAPGATRARGNTRGAGAAGNTWRANKAEQQATTSGSPFSQIKSQPSAPGGAAPAPQQKPAFTGFGRGSSTSSGAPSGQGGAGNARGGSRGGFSSAKPTNGVAGSVPVEDTSAVGNYNDRYEQLKIDRARQREQAIKAGQMADPNQPMSLNKAITPVGTCTSMCPEFERVERIVQKMVDKSEKYLHPTTNTLQNMEAKMLKRFRRSAAGYDEQLPSDIRTPATLLQSMNYLTRHVIGGPEPLGIIHKFVWDRTRSIRNDFSVQQVTQEEDVKIAVTCLERIARFHIVSLHLLSSPANEEPFDRHQEREQLNNTMLSLMYYYDDNRGRIMFPNEDEFRAYYIIFSIHDQRPDLEARVQKWPTELRNAPRVRVALELFAAAGNTWEYQGTLDSKRPNAIAQGFYARFFSLINSPGVSYLMACVAEIYFNHMRQTAIRSIWKGYCRYPASQQHKNEEWTVDELTNVLCFDDDEQTIKFCEEQDLEFAENANGDLYLNWGSRPVDSVAFQPSSEHSFSEHYVEAKRAGRNLVAIVIGLNVKEAATLGMVDRSVLSERGSDAPVQQMATDNESSLFVSEDENDLSTPASASSTGAPGVSGFGAGAGPSTAFGSVSQLANEAGQSIFSLKSDDAQAQAQQPPAPNPFGSLFTAKDTTDTSVTPSSPSLNPFAKPFSPPSTSQASESAQPTTTFPAPAAPAATTQSSNPFANASFAKPSPFAASQTPEPSQPTTIPLFPTNNAAPARAFSNTSPFTKQSQNKEESASPAASPFKFPTASQPLSSQTTAPSFFQTSQPAPSTTSPFNAPQSSSPFSIKPTQLDPTSDQPTGKAPSIFDLNKPSSPAPENKAPLFSFSPQGPTPLEKPSPSSTSQPQLAAATPPSFPSPFASKENKEATTILEPPASPRPALREIPPPVSFPQASADQPPASQETAVMAQSLVPREPEPEAPSESAIEIQPVSNQAEEPAAAISEEQESMEAKEAGAEAEAQKKAEWLHWLRDAADKRRSTVSTSTPASRKRVHEQETPPPYKITKAPKIPTPKQPPRKSMAAASMKPLPKLPILEQIEKLAARKPTEEKPAEPPKPNHVDEDDLLLSAARIAAESLRTGPRIVSSSASYEPWRASFSPASSVGSSIGTGTGGVFSRSESPNQSYISGYDVSLAPDSDLGLGRSLSRTEQRIRMTGGKGLAYKPLNLTSSPRDSWNSNTPSKRRKAT
ncbi:putative leucine permease transcriptional regulator (SAC3) [Aspergillus stella-maris]|uniref:putative leucine permease transcriptional regulator (SAC3) n=1 Tax=Aspergillus stella-maris TaxID=1810926 RepID=UPI003CCD1BA3